MALSDIDRNLLRRCLDQKPRAWEDFVDRFLGLVIHVITHTAKSRSIRLSSQDTEDLASEVMMGIISDNFAVLRRFRGDSSLATYLTVISRRIVVRELLKKKSPSNLSDIAKRSAAAVGGGGAQSPEERISNREQVERLLSGLNSPEAEIVRLYHLEGKSYQEISSQMGMPENSIGPTLSRARAKMRQGRPTHPGA